MASVAQKNSVKETVKNTDKNLDLYTLIQRVKKAQIEYAAFSQEKVDAIFKAAALAANNARVQLAKLAYTETSMGVIEDKVIKNHFASEYIYNKYRGMKTCGIVEEDENAGIIKIAEPVGIIAGVIPTTNPTSTAIFKALLALKTRNAIIFSPHPRAKLCTVQAANLVLEAAVAAGAPRDIIAWIDTPTVELSNELMKSPDINLILATGGPGMVKAAYSSGTPAIGVGAGNTPAIIDETADLKMAVTSILTSKTFDNGMICASEQSVIAHKKIYAEIKRLFTAQGGYILNTQEKEAVAKTIIKEGRLNAAIVGQKASTIARLAGIKVPAETKVLIGEVSAIGEEEAFSYEKLSPVLAMYKAESFEDAMDKADRLVVFGGMGHTSVLYTNPVNQDRIEAFGAIMKAGRILVNTPSSHGAIGDLFNFSLEPSLTLGCGSWGGNAVSENVGPKHLLNYKTVAARKENMLWLRVPSRVYFKAGAVDEGLNDLKGTKKAFIVTDAYLSGSRVMIPVIDKLEQLGIDYEIFNEVLPDPTLSTARAGAKRMAAFKPDAIIALGGGSPMDAAKIMWLLYEHPEADFTDMAMRFMDIRKRIYTFPEMGKKAQFVAIPTTSGTGSEVTPFAVITDDSTGIKYPIADYALTPDIAICDSNLVLDMPAKLTAYSGIDALTHALEAAVSLYATEFTTPMALEAIRLLFEYLPRAYKNGVKDIEAREKVHHAAVLAGMAFANAFLGICHSMAHKMGARFHLPHGLANALLISRVIRYNAVEAPAKYGTFSQYKYPQAIERYARTADTLGLEGRSDMDKVESLITAVEQLKAGLDIEPSIRAAGVPEKEFMNALDQLSEDAFDDQCTGANPRYPLISELRQLYIDAYNGETENK